MTWLVKRTYWDKFKILSVPHGSYCVSHLPLRGQGKLENKYYFAHGKTLSFSFESRWFLCFEVMAWNLVEIFWGWRLVFVRKYFLLPAGPTTIWVTKFCKQLLMYFLAASIFFFWRFILSCTSLSSLILPFLAWAGMLCHSSWICSHF